MSLQINIRVIILQGPEKHGHKQRNSPPIKRPKITTEGNKLIANANNSFFSLTSSRR